jgi:hypothetical protein
MPFSRFVVYGLAVLASTCGVSACTDSTVATTAKQTTSTTSTTTTTPTTTAAPATTAAPKGSLDIGPHPFAITGVSVSSVNWLTVDLHPSTLPIQLHATSTAPLQVCPANLDGTISVSGSSWPSRFNFLSCLPLDGAGNATLPASDGTYHLAFAIRPTAASVAASVSLTVSYTATDTFVAVLPPTTPGNTDMTVTFVPESTTIEDNIAPQGLSDAAPAPGYVATATQDGRSLSSPAACDFPTELDSCIGGVVPDTALAVKVSGPGASKVTVSLAWK